mmetsp:Transcript_87495/g.255835  ORF Transcript_87495/g.255835 Transcript_87495/m.255835 type:complete len:889 (+) Transcript_87495:11-2677(+)
MQNGSAPHAGERVDVDDGHGNWVGAVVTSSNPDGSVNVRYDDGTAENRVPAQYIRVKPIHEHEAGGSHSGFSSAFEPASQERDQAGEELLDQTYLPEHHQNLPPRRPLSREQVVEGGVRWGAGSRVTADYAGLGYYHPATVTAVHANGTYDLLYDDDLTEQHVPSTRIARPGDSRPGSGSGRRASPAAREKGVQPRPTARTPPPPSATPPPTRLEDVRVGSAVQGNWKGLGYWHPCVVMALLPGQAFLLRYEDGFEEEAPAGLVRLVGAAGSAFGSGEPDEPRKSPPLPRRGSRRAPSRAQDGEVPRKEAEQEGARIEVIKAKPEDKQWADAHGIGGERGVFQGMITRYRSKSAAAPSEMLAPAVSEMPISIFVRCRPMLSNETKNQDFEVVTTGSPSVSGTLVVHEPKVMVDLSKAMNNHIYTFDGVFGEASTNREIFEVALRPMVRHLLETKGGHGTCFAYGQTGSGKTVTMSGLGKAAQSPDNATGLYGYVAEEIFSYMSMSAQHGNPLVARCGFLEIYRGKCFDLLARRHPIEVREDEHGQQHLVGLQQVDLSSAQQLLQLLERSERTTRATAQNESSSRSHAILQITLLSSSAQSWQDGSLRCKLSLVDLAGSEWAAKAQSDDRGNRLDGAEINKSLLCLKECIRALGAKGPHVPFRGSKLTQVLKDSFVGKESRTVMIANISPSSASCDHSLNTLRYAQRVKDWQGQQGQHVEQQGSRQPPAPQSAPKLVRDSSKVQRQQQHNSIASTPKESASLLEEPRPAPCQHRDREADDLTQSLQWSPEQLQADQAATRLMQAQEALLAAHSASTRHAREMLPEAEALIEFGRQEGNMEQFAVRLRTMEQQRQHLADVVSSALLEYERCCTQEDEARLRVKSMNLPWE